MKKSIYLLIPVFFSIFVLPSISNAQAAQFETSMGLGANNPKAEVMKLQKFLSDRGFLKVAPTGNYLTLTKEAVSAFQKSQGIDSTGYFGPLTRAAANKISSGVVSTEVGTPTLTTIKSTGLSASAALSDAREIKWETKNYPAGVGVNLNLLRKTSDSPDEFVLVRQIAKDTPNDGSEIWFKNSKDGNIDTLYIEVTCSTSHSFEGGCNFSGKAIKVF